MENIDILLIWVACLSNANYKLLFYWNLSLFWPLERMANILQYDKIKDVYEN